jgi:hypothetical protein
VCTDPATGRLVEGLAGVEVRSFGEQGVRGKDLQLVLGAFVVQEFDLPKVR